MRHKLSIKIILLVLIYAVVGFLFVGFGVSFFVEKTSEKNEASRLYKEAIAIGNRYASEYYNGNATPEELDIQLKVISVYLNGEIQLVTRAGEIVSSSAMTSEDESVFIEDFDMSYFGDKYYAQGRFFNQYNEDVLSVYSPVVAQYKVRGYVMIHMPLRVVHSYGETYLEICYFGMVVLLLLGTLLIIIYLFSTHRRILVMDRVIKCYMEGDFSKTLKTGNDELGFIGASFNYMANELNTLEEDQKKLVSNISHDFRSPLTSIRGYLTAMLDGTIPPELYEKYLGVILSETDRLTKLTSGLLELNQYGSHGKTILDKTVFDLNELVRQTAATFEGSCSSKSITLELILCGDELLVQADKTRIGQVIYNLTDNAIKFSHHNSTIKIETLIKYDKVFVSVKDTGIGIPKESISKVFERFYKSDLSRGKDKKGTGLGLSIVKEIIQAHGENINVISTEGVGTEFIFTLDMADVE